MWQVVRTETGICLNFRQHDTLICQVAAHAEMLIPIFLAAESAAKGSGEPVEMDMSYGTHRVLLQHDALRPSS